MVNNKNVNGVMNKKQYISPSIVVTNLRTINATMQVFNSASLPNDYFKGAPVRFKDKAPVF